MPSFIRYISQRQYTLQKEHIYCTCSRRLKWNFVFYRLDVFSFYVFFDRRVKVTTFYYLQQRDSHT